MRLKLAFLAVSCLMFSACGGGSSSPTPVTTLPPTPNATIETVGAGRIEVHPSAVSSHAVAVVFPISIRETAGGSANWNFMRVSYLLEGREIERAERTATEISATGASNIGPRASVTQNVTLRSNSNDWDDVTITLGFSDKKDGRQFTTNVPFNSFSGVILDFSPAVAPGPPHD